MGSILRFMPGCSCETILTLNAAGALAAHQTAASPAVTAD